MNKRISPHNLAVLAAICEGHRLKELQLKSARYRSHLRIALFYRQLVDWGESWNTYFRPLKRKGKKGGPRLRCALMRLGIISKRVADACASPEGMELLSKLSTADQIAVIDRTGKAAQTYDWLVPKKAALPATAKAPKSPEQKFTESLGQCLRLAEPADSSFHHLLPPLRTLSSEAVKCRRKPFENDNPAAPN